MKRIELLVLSAILAAGYAVIAIMPTPPLLRGFPKAFGTAALESSGSVFIALASFQLYMSLTLIGLLVFLELTDPAHGEVRHFLGELRTSWLPYTILLLIMFSLIVAFKLATILSTK